MMRVRNATRYACSAFLVGLLSVAHAQDVSAYGAEGLFGGRAAPDFTVSLKSNVRTPERPDRLQSVLERSRPDYDPTPLLIQSFALYPSVQLGTTWDSNLYGTSSDLQNDTTLTARPTVAAQSTWGRHAVSAMVMGDMNFRVDNTAEDFQNFISKVEGRYDLAPQTWVTARGGYEYLVEPRSSPNNAAGSEPTTFNVGKLGAGAFRGAGKVKLGADYDALLIRFNNPPAEGGGVLNQGRRDRDQHLFKGRVGYELSGNVTPYVQGAYNMREYTNVDTRDSDGYEAVTGATVDLGGVTSFDAWIGWLEQFYDDFNGKDSRDALKIGGRLEWNVTPLTSAIFEFDRTVEETDIAAYNGALVSGGSVTVTHELRRNLLIEGNGGWSRFDYEGNGNRDDDEFVVGGGTRWFMNKNLYTDLAYNWLRRNSDLDSAEYSRHLVTLRLGVQY